MSAADLLAHRLDDPRVAAADVENRDPGEEVEVLEAALLVPQPAPFAAHELDRVADVGADRVRARSRPVRSAQGSLNGVDHRPLARIGEELEQQ